MLLLGWPAGCSQLATCSAVLPTSFHRCWPHSSVPVHASPSLPPSLLSPLAVSITYSVVALGLMSTVGALPTFGRDRVVFFRESASGEGGKCGAALRNHAACGTGAPSCVAVHAVVRAGRTGCLFPTWWPARASSNHIPYVPTTGLNRLAHFLALDTFDHAGTVLRSAVYLVMYINFASPRYAPLP